MSFSRESIASRALSTSPPSTNVSHLPTASTIDFSWRTASPSCFRFSLLLRLLTISKPPRAISLSRASNSSRNCLILATESAASEWSSRNEPRAAKNEEDAVEMAEMRCTSIVSMYHDNFSCKMAFVARAFLGPIAVPLEFLRSSGAPGAGRITSERSLTMSNVRGFSRWKSSSKYTFGMVERGASACVARFPGPPLERRLGEGASRVANEDSDDHDVFLDMLDFPF